MREADLAKIAGAQFNRVSRAQLDQLGFSGATITRRVAAGRLVMTEPAVFALAPVLDDDWGVWMGATLTAPHTFLSELSALAAYGCWGLARRYETVTRPGAGGPRRHGTLLVYRSSTLSGEVRTLRGVPITTMPRSLIDIAPKVSERALARTVREAVRLGHVTLPELGDALGRYRGRRGVRRLAGTVARYAGLPLGNARSGAEVRAMEILRDAGRDLPVLNGEIAGEEADLSWASHRLIIEIDGGPFHLDAGEDERKQAIWQDAGWTVRRLDADDVYEQPQALLDLAPPAPSVPN